MVRLGIIGCGMVTEKMHLPGFSAVPACSIAALCDVNPKPLHAMGSLYGVKSLYTDYHEMLKNSDIDAVCVNTPNYLHSRMTVDCCRAGKHVLVEKPVATSNAEAKRMKAVSADTGVIVMAEQYHRFVPTNERARDIIASGMLGKVRGFRGRLGTSGPARWAPNSGWFFNRQEAFGGALADIGVHIIDTVRWVAGVEIARVQGFTAKIASKGDVEDNACLAVETTGGLTGVFEASWTQHPNLMHYQIFCEKGMLETVNYKSLRAVLSDPPGEVTFEVPKDSVRGGPFKYFVECVRTGSKPFVDIEEGARSLAVVIAGYRAAVTGKAVAVGA